MSNAMPTLEIMDKLKDYIAAKTQEIVDGELTVSNKCQALLDAFQEFLVDHKLKRTRFLENMRKVGERTIGDADVKSIRVGRFIVSYLPVDVISRRYMEAWSLDREIIQTAPVMQAEPPTAESDIEMFMDDFKQILEQSDGNSEDEDDEEEEEDDEPAPKKQRTASPDQLTVDEALDITFAAFDFYIRKYFDGDISYVDGAKNYGKQVCTKAKELKAEYKERFDAASVIAAFGQMTRKNWVVFNKL